MAIKNKSNKLLLEEPYPRKITSNIFNNIINSFSIYLQATAWLIGIVVFLIVFEIIPLILVAITVTAISGSYFLRKLAKRQPLNSANKLASNNNLPPTQGEL